MTNLVWCGQGEEEEWRRGQGEAMQWIGACGRRWKKTWRTRIENTGIELRLLHKAARGVAQLHLSPAPKGAGPELMHGKAKGIDAVLVWLAFQQTCNTNPVGNQHRIEKRKRPMKKGGQQNGCNNKKRSG